MTKFTTEGAKCCAGYCAVFVLSALFWPAVDTRASDYREPSAEITALLVAPKPPEPLLHATTGQVARLYREPVIALDRLALPRLGLAGRRFEPVSGISKVEALISRVDVLSVNAAADQPPVLWQPRANTLLDFIQFSPDGNTLSAVAIGEGMARLVLFDISRQTERELDVPINPAWGNPCRWTMKNELICHVVVESRGKAPAAAPSPTLVEHTGGPVPVRTYSNLLKGSHDDQLFEYYFSSQLAITDVSGKWERKLGPQGLLTNLEVSPDGQYVVVERVQRPYSRLVPAYRFPSSIEIWDLARGVQLYASSVVGFGLDETEREKADPRRFNWKEDGSNTLGYIDKSLDEEGNRVYQWMAIAAPFEGPARKVAAGDKNFRSFGWTTAGTPWFQTRGDTAEEAVVQMIVDQETVELWRGRAADRYSDPGRALRINGSDGPVLEDDGRLFLAGDGLSDAGPQPFLDTIELRTGRTKRVYSAEAKTYEPVLGITGIEPLSFITSRESDTDQPNLYFHREGIKSAMSPLPDPYPQLQGVSRQLLTYKRADGLDLSATLYLPKDYVKGDALPTLVWIYPHDFSDEGEAEQVDIRAFRFHRVIGPSALAAVAAGYAVMMNPTMPILHSDIDSNDGYLPQLIASAEAAVSTLVDMGVTDPARVAVGGRSYGAFSAANLLIHSDIFATAIAMSGAYNRTLTPFGFQHEHRSFWDAMGMYTKVSPFFHADEYNEPILLVHGGNDENAGTLPLQAWRFFHALAGEGATVRYVELPYEGHHYWARESVLLAAAEMLDWLDRTIGPEADLETHQVAKDGKKGPK